MAKNRFKNLKDNEMISYARMSHEICNILNKHEKIYLQNWMNTHDF